MPLPVETEVIEARVPRHGTLDGILRQHQIPADLVIAAVESTRAVFNPRQLRADRPYRLVRSLDGLLREFEYQIDADRFLRIVSRADEGPAGLEVEVVEYEKDTEVTAVRGQIDAQRSSLIAAMNHAGENIQLALQLADIFGSQIDFQSDLQPGDAFEVLFEKSTRDGEFVGYGAVLGARFSNSGKTYQAFRWVNPANGKADYYDEDGRSLRRFFLASPLKFTARVTSGFTYRRLHPVHGGYRPHLGVDYGAPTGAPVVSVAHGTVVSAGWAGGGGNQVRIRHANGYESYYLHLSRFAAGMRSGTRVSQGQVIGYVGATGTATGPHLDYRLRKNGVFVNPLVEHRKLPPGEPIPSLYLAGFRAERDGILGQITDVLLADAAQERPDATPAVE